MYLYKYQKSSHSIYAVNTVHVHTTSEYNRTHTFLLDTHLVDVNVNVCIKRILQITQEVLSILDRASAELQRLTYISIQVNHTQFIDTRRESVPYIYISSVIACRYSNSDARALEGDECFVEWNPIRSPIITRHDLRRTTRDNLRKYAYPPRIGRFTNKYTHRYIAHEIISHKINAKNIHSNATIPGVHVARKSNTTHDTRDMDKETHTHQQTPHQKRRTH